MCFQLKNQWENFFPLTYSSGPRWPLYYRRAKGNPTEHVRDILITEIMNIESSQFEKEAIDMDDISFARK